MKKPIKGDVIDLKSHRPKTKKRGLPKALDPVDEVHESPEEFAKRFFAEPGFVPVPQNGMPPLDWLKETYKTKSAAIRYLHHKGYTPNQIHKHLGIRYQHARNVCKTELKRGPNEDWRPPEMRIPPEPPSTTPTTTEEVD